MNWVIIIQDIEAALTALGPIIQQIVSLIQSASAPKADAPVKTVTFTIGKNAAGQVEVKIS